MNRDLVDMMGGGHGRAPEHSDDDPLPGKTEHCEFELVLHYDNEARGAILVSETGEEAKAVWLSKSEIQFTPTGKTAPAKTTQGKLLAVQRPVVTVSVPEWLAKDRGLI